MELKQFQSLVALAKFRSISLAADRLHMTPPGVHKQLKSLEQELGVPLYEKVGRQLHLTYSAEFLLPYFKEMLAQYDATLMAVDELKGGKRGLVRIGSGPASYLLPVMLKKFRQRYPEVEVQVESGGTPILLEDLTTGSLDVALVVLADLIGAHNLFVERTWDYELVLVSRAGQCPRQCRLTDLNDHPFILFRQGSRFEESISRYFYEHGFDPKVSMRFDNAEFIKSMVLSGFGIAMLPLWLVHKETSEGELSIIHQNEPPLYLTLSLVRRKASFTPRAVQALIGVACSLETKDLCPLKRSTLDGSQ